MKKNDCYRIILVALLMVGTLPSLAQLVIPKVSPKAQYYDKKDEFHEVSSIDEGEAPLNVKFFANPENMDGLTPSFEWHFRKADRINTTKWTELFVRYEEDTEYTFTESGTYHVVLKTNTGSEDHYVDSVSVDVVIVESSLEFPNAFSPNGDDINDKFKAKDGWKSIVEFRAIILSRWGQKIYEWTDPAGEWDGKYNGKDVKEGVYYLLVRAKGADGHEYNIRRDINLIRGYTKDGSSSTNK